MSQKSLQLTIDEVKHVAQLADLPLSEEEITKLQPQLTKVIDLVSKLSEVETKGVAETSQVTGQVNVFREDEVDNSRTLTQKEALANALNTQDGYFVVPKIIDD